MAQDKKPTINLDALDQYYCSMGFLFPTNERQLDLFDKIYSDYNFALKDFILDIDAIVNGKLKKNKLEIDSFSVDFSEIEELRMAARKGSEELPQDIIDKMLSKHKRKSNDKE